MDICVGRLRLYLSWQNMDVLPAFDAPTSSTFFLADGRRLISQKMPCRLKVSAFKTMRLRKTTLKTLNGELTYAKHDNHNSECQAEVGRLSKRLEHLRELIHSFLLCLSPLSFALERFSKFHSN